MSLTDLGFNQCPQANAVGVCNPTRVDGEHRIRFTETSPAPHGGSISAIDTDLMFEKGTTS